MTNRTKRDIEKVIKAGRRQAEKAQALREDTRWSVPKTDVYRRQVLTEEIRYLGVVMKPIRSEIGRIAWRTRPLDPKIEQELRDVSAALQYERKQLKKMLRRTDAALSRSE